MLNPSNKHKSTTALYSVIQGAVVVDEITACGHETDHSWSQFKSN
jgi:hypothetical protein